MRSTGARNAARRSPTKALPRGAGLGADALVAQPADQLGDDFIASEGRHQVDALDEGPGVVEELARLLQALGDSVFTGFAHALAKRLRDDDTGDLVVHELGVSRRLQRKHTEQKWDGQWSGLLEEALEGGEVVEGLGHRDVGTRLDLLPG